MTAMNPVCCVVDCVDAAPFVITHHCGHPECITEACEAHIGALLGCISLASDVSQVGVWTVEQVMQSDEGVLLADGAPEEGA